MKLSIVIVNYNVAYFLENCLNSVIRACNGISYEIFVVDNASVDNSINMLKEKFPTINLIANRENVGFAKANNQAILLSQGEYILLLNPDTLVEEDTFTKCISFMEKTPDAGALGVKMIDGSGKYLKESKRGFPSPMVSFYKLSGLIKLFPHSKKYAQYYLGHLSEDEINQVDVLAGAYMFIRKEVLDKIGLLDEDFFMYGEDIDLSYRITQSGYKNYYFPKARIIHYKGESTKKTSLNYVYTFYNAMAIFASKHLSQKQTKIFSLFIKIAIWLKASFSFLSRIFRNLLTPIIDFIFVYIAYYLLILWWGENIWGDPNYYPPQYTLLVVPLYILIWLFSIYIMGGYSKETKINKIVSGVFFGMVTILVFYSLLPEQLRYSRALVLLGAVVALFVIIVLRLISNFLKTGSWSIKDRDKKRYIIIGDDKEAVRVATLLRSTEENPQFIGLVAEKEREITENNFIGNITQIEDIINIYKINEVIFCAKSLSQEQIISMMSFLGNKNLHLVIAPQESNFIISSNRISTPVDLYVISVNSITSQDNRRKKRLLDVSLSIFTLIFSPIIIFMIKEKKNLFKNIFLVLLAKRSWVGYVRMENGNIEDPLEKIKPSILSNKDVLFDKQLSDDTINRLNLLYARNYNWQNDIDIFFKAFKFIGR
ncbi:MAG: glycosyltransferase family 2 protein [Bacteroidales bacterium]|jgi:GT2 family glycosyltransferase|nr:glycosyltransferase family 2 protein [Bacteroidales bacterium]